MTKVKIPRTESIKVGTIISRLAKLWHQLDRASSMKFPAGVLAGLLLLTGTGASHAVVRIANDRGGSIAYYIERYEKLRAARQSVVIDGLCASACTIVLGTIASDDICVTPKARLAFHAAWDFGRNGRAFTHRAATQMLYSMYPSPIQQWLDRRGGLTSRTVFLQGKQLHGMYRGCDLDP
ncbi:ATP-dependent protease ClpP protease subunit [Bradyrhizobium daqingense]